MSGNSLAAEPTLNATPLIDVLLVLLVLLILTLPVATHAIKVNLPQGLPTTPPQAVIVRIYTGGEMYWNDERVESLRLLVPRFDALAKQSNPPILKVVPDRWAPYDQVAKVLSAARRSDVKRLSVAPIAN
jgi:biopolymer transport protein ExbD